MYTPFHMTGVCFPLKEETVYHRTNRWPRCHRLNLNLCGG
jgi:hypothetical protein